MHDRYLSSEYIIAIQCEIDDWLTSMSINDIVYAFTRASVKQEKKMLSWQRTEMPTNTHKGALHHLERKQAERLERQQRTKRRRVAVVRTNKLEFISLPPSLSFSLSLSFSCVLFHSADTQQWSETSVFSTPFRTRIPFWEKVQSSGLWLHECACLQHLERPPLNIYVGQMWKWKFTFLFNTTNNLKNVDKRVKNGDGNHFRNYVSQKLGEYNKQYCWI